MKKKKIKNRKAENRKRRFLYVSIAISVFLLCGSIAFVSLRFFASHPFVSPLPIMSVSGGAKKSSQKNVVIQEISDQLHHAAISYKSIQMLDSATCRITLSDDSQVILSTAKDISAQIASLQLITTRLTMEGKRFSRLDLRYNQPVIVF